MRRRRYPWTKRKPATNTLLLGPLVLEGGKYIQYPKTTKNDDAKNGPNEDTTKTHSEVGLTEKTHIQRKCYSPLRVYEV